MAFDASRGSDPDGEPHRQFQDEPIDYVDWAMRIAVFGPLLLLYSYWIWTVIKTAFIAITGG
jgi:hypothetical protein